MLRLEVVLEQCLDRRPGVAAGQVANELTQDFLALLWQRATPSGGDRGDAQRLGIDQTQVISAKLGADRHVDVRRVVALDLVALEVGDRIGNPFAVLVHRGAEVEGP